MPDLKLFVEKIKEKRKNTSFREYLKEIVSLRTLMLYKNNNFISVYPDLTRVKSIISHTDFEKSRDDLLKKGIDYDFNKKFFENFTILFEKVDFQPTVIFGESENVAFTDQTLYVKNSYLSFVVIRGCENVLYSFSIKENSINILNSVMVWNNCENIYFSNAIIESYNIFYSKSIMNSSNIWFSTNLIECNECIFCDEIENQSYCIKNEIFSKEDYFIEKNKILQDKNNFLNNYKNLKSKGKNYGSNKITGVFNIKCENIENGANNYQIKNSRNVMFIGGKGEGENIYDCFTNTPPEKDIYGVFSTGYADNIYNSWQINGGTNVFYSGILDTCSFCIGCIGLKNKSFCILNKQYSKEEWLKRADKIFSQMDKDGILGDFFPGSLNPFYFNDTMAYLIDDSFTKDEVEKEGYLWRNENIKVDIPENAEIIYTKDLQNFQGFDSNGNWQINPEILKKVIQDENGNIYKIVKMEYDFLLKYGLPLPEIHWTSRIKLGFKF